jgi:hypothetical protein
MRHPGRLIASRANALAFARSSGPVAPAWVRVKCPWSPGRIAGRR